MKAKSIVVLYDTKNGEILYTNDYSNLAELPTEAQMEDEAISLAIKNTGRQRSEFAALHLPTGEMRDDVEYKVDVQKKSLVAKDHSYRKEK